MMDLFGGANYARASDFESFKTAINNDINGIKSEIGGLRHDINLKATDSEETAKKAAAGAVEAQNRVSGLETQFKDELEGLRQIRSAAKIEVDSIVAECEKTKSANAELLSSVDQTTRLFNAMLTAKSEVDLAKESIHSNIESINQALSNSETLPEAVTKVEEILGNSEELFSKISDLLSHSAAKKGEIDDLRDKILGKEIEVDGSNTHVDGIKDKLEKAYSDIDSRINGLEAQIELLINSVKADHERQLSQHLGVFEDLVSKSKARINEVDTELKNLLPGGMAAGLSAAYGKKKDDETDFLAKSELKFQNAIRNMIIISTIPFLVDTYLLFWEKLGLAKVIQDTPNLQPN